MALSGPAMARAPLRLEHLDPPVRGLILDMDGVLWKDMLPIGDLPAAFDAISARGLRLIAATNNATKTVDEYLLKFRAFGVKLEARQIVTSAEAMAETLAARFPARGRAFVVGEAGIIGALQGCGFDALTDPEADNHFDVVVAGLDRSLTYSKLQRAAELVRGGTPFYGTNADPTFPTPSGMVPGAGSILAAIATASGTQPVVVGKPSPLLFEIACAWMDLPREQVLIVGDRLETDVAGGQAFGARTALVLSGVTTSQQAAAWSPPPDLISESLNQLLGA